MSGPEQGPSPDTREPAPLASGYQGVVYRISEGGRELIVKQAMGSRLLRPFRRAMIRREYAAYQRLAGIRGVPECFGLRDGDRLVLEYIDGVPLRDAADHLPDPQRFFTELRSVILDLHAAGVAHADLKRKDNSLVGADGLPYLIDFGSAGLLGERAGPVNRYLFRQACRIDLNAWIKLKYRRRYDRISPEDLPYYRPTLAERVARPVRNAWRALTGRQWRKARQRRRGGN